MLLTGRRLLVTLSIVVAAAGLAIFFLVPGVERWIGLIVASCGLVSAIVLNVFALPFLARGGPVEPDTIGDVPLTRRQELVRGTSKYLREMNYRYSIRRDPADGGERQCFSAEVNTIRLGFVPVFITDNTNDRQGPGYVAFVYDGKRWRGPGLPCPAGQAEAVRHAARSVSPLATEEETAF